MLGTSRAVAVKGFVRTAESLHIPALCDVEVASAFRRLLLSAHIHEHRAREALRDYVDLPLTRHGHQTLLARVLSLRSNFSAYDATYIALAERLAAPLVTCDETLARAIESHLEIETVLV